MPSNQRITKSVRTAIVTIAATCFWGLSVTAQCIPQNQWSSAVGLTGGLVWEATHWSQSQFLAGGSFTAVGGAAVNGVALWNGSSWVDTGSPSGTIYSMTTLANGTVAAEIDNDLWQWDGANWQVLGPAFPAGRLVALPDGGMVAVGYFMTGSGSPAPSNGVARWDGTTWVAMGTGVGNPTAYGATSASVLPNGDIVIGGQF